MKYLGLFVIGFILISIIMPPIMGALLMKTTSASLEFATQTAVMLSISGTIFLVCIFIYNLFIKKRNHDM